jgi:hypothetical protein
MVAKLSDRIEGNKYNGVGNANPNLLINGDRLINQRVFAGGQPAANVYGADRWKGSADGLQIEQVVENTESLDELATISWQGGTGTASVNGQSGLISGETFTLTTSGNYSVIVPTDASKIKLEYGNTATPYQARPIGEELALCQRYLWRGLPCKDLSSFAANNGDEISWPVSFGQQMRQIPAITYSFSGSVISNLKDPIANAPSLNGVRFLVIGTGITSNGFIVFGVNDYIQADAEIY